MRPPGIGYRGRTVGTQELQKEFQWPRHPDRVGSAIIIAAVVVAAIVAVGAVFFCHHPRIRRRPRPVRNLGRRDCRSAGRAAAGRRSSRWPRRTRCRARPASRPQLAGQLANPALAQFSGIVIDPATGAVIWNKDSNAPQLPASTAKLLTGTALLTSVDPTSRFVTKVVQGDQEGDIVLVGGGDVTLSARNEGVGTVYDGAPLMADLAAQVRASGIDVKRIVLDTDYWSGPDLADGWQTGDIRGTAGQRAGLHHPDVAADGGRRPGGPGQRELHPDR